MTAGTQLAEHKRGTGGGKTHVCVIGAGSSGIAACQVLHARGLPPYIRTLRRERRRVRRGGLPGLLARRSHELRLGSPSA